MSIPMPAIKLLRTHPVILVADGDPGVVSDDSLVQGQDGLVSSLQPPDLVLSEIVDLALQHGLPAHVDGDVVDGPRKHGVTAGDVALTAVLHRTCSETGGVLVAIV